jgi:DnaJ-class molecular chaperone
VFHWLSPACPACDGVGKRPVPYGKEQAKEACKHCRGEGTWPRPLGAQDVHNHIKSCLGKVKGGMAGALYG